MRTLPCLSAVLLAAALAGCAAQPKTVAAPEYDWAAGFEETCARLDEAGLSTPPPRPRTAAMPASSWKAAPCLR